MIRPIYSSGVDISISDFLSILQAALNEDILRVGKTFTHFNGFTEGSFAPALTESATLSAQWTVSISPGKVFFPNGQVAIHEDGPINIPIQHYGTQYIIISHETQRMTTGLYPEQQKPSDETVYFVDKIRIRSSLGASVPSMGDNEMLICKIIYSLTSDPIVVDLRAPYSARWSVPYSISSGDKPSATLEIMQNMHLRNASLSNRTMNTESSSRNDDSIAIMSFSISEALGSIMNGRIERINGSSFDLNDILFYALDGSAFSAYELSLHSDSYRIALTDAFQEDMTSQWSEQIEPPSQSGVPSVAVSTVGATAIISASRGTVTGENPICVIWASEGPISSSDNPIWIGPFASGNLLNNKGGQLNITMTATSIHYKVAALTQFGHLIGSTSGVAAVTPEWPLNTRLSVLNIMPDLTDEAHGTYGYSTDNHLAGEEFPFISYFNPSESTIVVTKITFESGVVGESSASESVISAKPEGGSATQLFTLSTAATGVYLSNTYTWEGIISVPAGKMLEFRATTMNRNQGHIYIESYSL